MAARNPNRLKPARPFTVRALDAWDIPGLYGDGGGLYLQVTALKGGGVTKSWIFRYRSPVTWTGRYMGLGSFTVDPKKKKGLTLKAARKEAALHQDTLAKMKDPIVENEKFLRELREAHRTAVTFDEAATQYWNTHKSNWKSEKHADNWVGKLRTYAMPILGPMMVSDIETAHVLKVLQQPCKRPDGQLGTLWDVHDDTASKLRGAIENILDYSKGHGYRSGDNPAIWKGNLKEMLPKSLRIKKRVPRPALPHKEIGAFTAALHELNGVGPAALEFLILTACRTSEVLGASWSEFDMDEAVWTIPAERMKAGKEHTVTLSPRAVEIIQEMEKIKSDSLVFPSGEKGETLSDAVLNAVVKRMHEKRLATEKKGWVDPNLKGRRIVPHGFRATFRTWAGDQTHYPREVIEKALAHQLKDKAEASYARGELIEKRRPLMNAWASYCAQVDVPVSNIIPIGSAL